MVCHSAVQPWFDLLTSFSKDPLAAAELKTSPAVLKSSVANLLTLVRSLVHTRASCQDYSSRRQIQDHQAEMRTLIILQAAVVQMEGSIDEATYGVVEEPLAAEALKQFITLSKTLLEGDPSTQLVGLNRILTGAGQQAIDRLKDELQNALDSLSETCEGDFTNLKQSWTAGLEPTCSWNAECEKAGTSLLTATKAQLMDLNSRLDVATKAT